jgi:hypothetical protein
MQTPSLTAGSNQLISFKVTRASGGVVRGFQPIDGAPMQLILVAADLRSFVHVTPTAAHDGHWSATVNVPAPGSYGAFVHFKRGGQEHSLGAWVSAPGPVAASAAVVPALVVPAGPVTVALKPIRIQAGRKVRLNFMVTTGGRPVAASGVLAGEHGFLFGARASDLSQVYGLRVGSGPPTRGLWSFDAEFPVPGTYRLFLTLPPVTTSVTAQLGVTVHPGS